MSADLFGRTIDWPAVAGRRVLALGLGGGSDAIIAYAIAHMLDASVAYGNTKHELDSDLVRISPRIGHLPSDAAIRGKTKIERRLPRGPRGSPLVLALARDDDPATLTRELAALAFEHVIGVDTGGDALDPSARGDRGRDRRMLDVVRRLGVPALLVVVAPGADGQLPRERLDELLTAAVAAGRYRGAFSLEPLAPTLREHARWLGPERTPNIICRALDEAADPVAVPRGCRPQVPRRWLTAGFGFDLAITRAR